MVKYYFNNRNEHKQLEVHIYECGHVSVRQFMAFGNGVVNKLGDGCLHRWNKRNLNELLKDYTEIH